jgi:DHA1 family bicyclomycin/chloramphenicol resistance-like MFS transporter
MIAPVIGAALLAVLGWRAIFATLAGCGVILSVIAHLILSETLPAERRAVASVRGLARGYARFFTTPGTRLPLAVSCTCFAGQFAYIADSPFVYLDGFHVSTTAYAIYYGSTALAMMLGSLAGARILRAGRSPGAMIVMGTLLLLVGGLLVTGGTRFGDLGIVGFLVPMIIFFFGSGLTSPSATAMALQPLPELAGTASAAIGFFTIGTGTLSGYETTKIGGSSPQVFSAVVLVMGVLAAVLASSAAIARKRQKQQLSR